MNNINDGGLAFPGKRSQQVNVFVDSEGNTNPTYADCEYPGMSLRDYFAAKALSGMLASETDASTYREDVVADRAYAIADSMLKAREP